MGREFLMVKTTSVELGSELGTFVSIGVQKGRYRSASEMLRAGLRLLQFEEAKLEALRGALIEGEESGAPQKFKAGKLLNMIEGDFE
jgi:antitoxin ParD1/3/4